MTVHFGGWDHHWNLELCMKHHLPRFDSAVAGLIEDLDQRGMLMFCLLGGGKIHGGIVVGLADEKGMRPQTRTVRPDNIHATVYSAMGLDPGLHLLDHGGHPTPVIEDLTPIAESL